LAGGKSLTKRLKYCVGRCKANPHDGDAVTSNSLVQKSRQVSNRKQNPMSGYNHSQYSLRHTAICMRLTLSKGKVNIYRLAKNAGTSVYQIERFDARNLPLSAEPFRNLQSFRNGSSYFLGITG
jgi:hypothetical protein